MAITAGQGSHDIISLNPLVNQGTDTELLQHILDLFYL
jgi:hypothetical protein